MLVPSLSWQIDRVSALTMAPHHEAKAAVLSSSAVARCATRLLTVAFVDS
jgi:hypothetical protein